MVVGNRAVDHTLMDMLLLETRFWKDFDLTGATNAITSIWPYLLANDFFLSCLKSVALNFVVSIELGLGNVVPCIPPARMVSHELSSVTASVHVS